MAKTEVLERERRAGGVSTKEVVRRYYDGIARKDGWQSVISDTIRFSGTGVKSTQGKQAYVEATARFLRGVQRSEATKTIIEGNEAWAVVRYDMRSPKGNTMLAEVVEILSVKEGKIESSVIFFDTAAFSAFMAKG